MLGEHKKQQEDLKGRLTCAVQAFICKCLLHSALIFYLQITTLGILHITTLLYK